MIITLGASYYKVPGSLGVSPFRGPQTDLVVPEGSLETIIDEFALGIYCYDFLHHLTLGEGVKILRECWRVLKPSGSYLEISVPDMEVLCAEYIKGVEGNTRLRLVGQFFGSESQPAVRSGYDEFLLTERLRDAGFSSIRPLAQPSHPFLTHDERLARYLTVVALK